MELLYVTKWFVMELAYLAVSDGVEELVDLCWRVDFFLGVGKGMRWGKSIYTKYPLDSAQHKQVFLQGSYMDISASTNRSFCTWSSKFNSYRYKNEYIHVHSSPFQLRTNLCSSSFSFKDAVKQWVSSISVLIFQTNHFIHHHYHQLL